MDRKLAVTGAKIKGFCSGRETGAIPISESAVWDYLLLMFIKAQFLVSLVLFSLVTAGCSSLKPSDFAGSSTTFEPDKYFTGHVRSWGVTENRGGQPHSHFTTESFGTVEAGGDVRIEQTFHYAGGRTQQRIWHVHRIDTHHYEATANDVVGKARGEAQGKVFCWDYTIAVKPGNPFSHVHLRQWMYLPEGTETMFTRAEVKKFGIILQQITESFQRVP
jgi:hypothetical protein